MKIASFTYRKSNGDVSERVAAILAEPRVNVLAIDITELDEVAQAEFGLELAALNLRREAELEYLLKRYDVTNNFRSFKPERMTNVVEDE